MSDEADNNWGILFCWGLAGICGLYAVVGVYSNVSSGKSGAEVIPHVAFWSSLGGLVKDGFAHSMGQEVEKHYEPVPRLDPSNPGMQGGAPVVQGAYPADVEDPGRRRRRSSARDGKRKKKKKPSDGEERIVVIGPDGKKKIKRKVRKGDKKGEKSRRGSSSGGSTPVKVKKSKGRASSASLE